MKYIITGLVLVIPLCISFLMHLNVFSKALGDANGWLGYWGGYLGALIGAATVYLLTNKQIQAQKELHKETLNGQLKLHESNLIQQRKLQMDSIEESAKVNDQRQRELIIAQLKISKIELIIQDLITIQTLSTERFNSLRHYNQYNVLKKSLVKSIKNKRSRIRAQMILDRKSVTMSKSTITIQLGRLNNIQRKYKRFKLDKALELRKYYLEKIDEILEKETDIRNEIRKHSAKIKSNAMISNFDDELNEYRGYLNNVSEVFYEIVSKDRLSELGFYGLIDFHVDKHLIETNKALNKCKKRLSEELLLFSRGEVKP
ncbi:hypothetical protein [Litchfieldia salsa]|uniref:Uncharacterized protein n=1 Tax=Litchfieldia salsa TaxID=930152 RepID=A0A1H0W680_9BACI|nr:hypothetical protein [Litchfieldia salsa]SDP86272.1 hypothetical protein SAMN05216565_109121 [Litchfieldia salsa]